MGVRSLQRLQYLGVAETDALAKPSYLDMSFGSYGGITYGKTATMLLTLENVVGEDTLRKALHTYFMKYRFTHPTHEDFLRTVNELAGEELGWYWQQAVYGTQVLDYKVLKAESLRVDWADKNAPDEEKGKTMYETNVLIQRLGDFILPVTVQVKFDNGETVRERWVGVDRWKRFTYLKKAKVLSVEIDPDHQITMDRDYLNNSIAKETQYRATEKITAYWMFVTQFWAQMLSWLV
jgi:hypothetical protein